MRAAVIRRAGATPALDQFADPQPGQGLSVGTLVAAALNPLGSWAPAGSSGPPEERPSNKPLTAGPTRSSTSQMTRPSTPAWPPQRPAATT